MIEFIYAIVGIVWLTQYYTSCNDLTAKNVTLGTAAPAQGGRRGSWSPGGGRRGLPPCQQLRAPQQLQSRLL